jgi:hypothetical protein
MVQAAEDVARSRQLRVGIVDCDVHPFPTSIVEIKR